MFHNIKKRNEGFTIIEVLIVLAIAALIMLIVFLAVPALQRNQRNNARNSEASRISAAVTECLSNRNGQTTSCDTLAEIGFTVSGTPAVITGFGQIAAINFAAGTGTTTSANVQYNTMCNPEGTGLAATNTSGPRAFTVRYQLESGGGGTINRCIAS